MSDYDDEFFEYNDDPAFDDLEMRNWREEMKASILRKKGEIRETDKNKEQKYKNDKIHNEIFCPSKETKEIYNKQLTNLYTSEESKFKTIDMGALPEIYRELGIKDTQLKTNGKAIFKHNLPVEVIRKLISLAYDPQAVFKSLSTSSNPNGYIAVLDAKTNEDEQIIAVLSPSKDGKGFTFIPTVYGKRNFDLFLEKTLNEQKVLYIKSESSEIWGQLQSLPRHKSEPSIKNILTKQDIVNKFFNNKNIEAARKAGYVQGVCECVAAIGEDHALGKKLLTEMNVNKETAKKYANPETYKTLEQGIFAPKPKQQIEQTHSRKR